MRNTGVPSNLSISRYHGRSINAVLPGRPGATLLDVVVKDRGSLREEVALGELDGLWAGELLVGPRDKLTEEDVEFASRIPHHGPAKSPDDGESKDGLNPNDALKKRRKREEKVNFSSWKLDYLFL